MKQKRVFIFSAILSLLVHVLFLGISYFLWVPGVMGVQPATEKLFRIKSARVDVPERTLESIARDSVRQLKFEKPAGEINELMSDKLLETAKVAKHDPFKSVTPESPEINTVAKEMQPPPPALVGPTDTVKINKREVLPLQKSLDADFLRSTNDVTAPERRSVITVPKEFLETSDSFVPEKAVRLEANSPQGELAAVSRAEMPEEHTFDPDPENVPLDRFLTVRIYTYTSPTDGQKYFQLSIFPTPEAEGLEVMPKEVIYLLDASLSIRGDRMREFKEGIAYALKHLNPQDRFNIYVFKSSITPFAPNSIPVSWNTVPDAMRFLDKASTSGTTDIYEALYETIQSPPILLPSYIILLSDGKPTEGVRSSAELIKKVTRTNDKERPIFTFSGGSRVDRFFLDFLSYPNRGWSEYTAQTSEISEQLSQLYDKIRNPVLVNVRYQITPIKGQDTFPQNLPDFYRDTVFTVFGKYDSETKFSIRVLGEIGDLTKEFIYSADLSKASPGGPDIARFWAFNKIYHIISRINMEGANEKDKAEIAALTQKYGLEIPYDFDDIF